MLLTRVWKESVLPDDYEEDNSKGYPTDPGEPRESLILLLLLLLLLLLESTNRLIDSEKWVDIAFPLAVEVALLADEFYYYCCYRCCW